MARFEADFIKREYQSLTIYADTRDEAFEVAREYLDDLNGYEGGYELDYVAGPFPQGEKR